MTTTAKKTLPAPSNATDGAPTSVQPEPQEAAPPTVVGPALVGGAEPQTVVLSAHLHIGGSDYGPGDKILVSPDYARRLRGQGYTART